MFSVDKNTSTVPQERKGDNESQKSNQIHGLKTNFMAFQISIKCKAEIKTCDV